MAIVTVETLRQIQWDKSNLWDITIPGSPADFHAWIPINDLQMGFFGVTAEQAGSSGLEFPATRTVPTFNLSYYDNENLSMTHWFSKWLKQTVSLDGYRVAHLESIQRDIIVTKLNSMREPIYTWSFKAFPTGNIEYHGDSDGSLSIYTLTFTVSAGELIWKDN